VTVPANDISPIPMHGAAQRHAYQRRRLSMREGDPQHSNVQSDQPS
jgi:hypothetical protein